MRKANSFLMFVLLMIATSINAQNIQNSIEKEITQLVENKVLSFEDSQWEITSQHTSRVSNVLHVYYHQIFNGIKINGTESSIHLLSNGETLKSNNQFVSNVNQRTVGGTTPSLNAMQAVQSAASYFGYNISEDLSVTERKNNASQQMKLSGGGISLSEIPVKLVYETTSEGNIVLAWDLSIDEIAQENWWSVSVDAQSGQILRQINWMSSCNFDHDHSLHEDVLNYNKNLYDIPNYGKTTISKNINTASAGGNGSYEVFRLPLESPFFGSRTIQTGADADPIASPFGWHDTNGVSGAEFTTTRGNNTNSYEDGDNQGFQPNGGASLDFTGYPFNINYSPTNQFESSAITNLFYWNNIIHDVLYQYGFDEVSGNFQENNYGNGGNGSDSVNSEAQDGSGTCNANFGTPPDGDNPRMQMFICNNRDGDYDNLVIIHEYGHGISNRLTGGPSASGCLQNTEQMGEGWSDWYGVVMTMLPGAQPEDARPVGTFLFNQGPTGGGIRPFPYSTDLSVNPQTYDDIKTAAVPHGVGSVWSTMLWEMTWELINEHGWDANIYNFTGDVNQDAGNVMAMALVTEGLKLQPCNPGFVDGRDAIIAADQAIYGGANECLIWDAFAKRGLGVSASQGSSNSRSDGTEAFDTPSATAVLADQMDVCEGTEVLTDLSGGTPFGGVYSGPGVTDNGDGATFTFDPAIAGVGVHVISYEVTSTNCAVASTDTNTIEVLEVEDGPSTVGVADFCLGDEVTVSATPVDPTNVIRWFDASSGGNFLFQGNDYTFTPTGDQTLWAQETPNLPISQLKISEITLETPDQLEIQNIGEAADYSGYTIAVSDMQPGSNINTVNPETQTLGNIGSNNVVSWTDDNGGGNWGENIWWGEDIGGWIVIIDDQGNVVDSVFWNLSAAEINTFNVTINGFNITASDLDWSGAGANFNVPCNNSFRRSGETDNAANWPTVCLPSDFGSANTDISIGFEGCLSARSETIVNADDLAPEVTCPEDVDVVINQGTQFTIPDYTPGATATDNCTTPVLTQSPAAGDQVGVGTYDITITATDAAGNSIDCTFVLNVTEILANNDFALNNAITLFPNPTSGTINIRNTSTTEIETIAIVDVNGRLIKTINNNGTLDSFSISNLASGMYFVRINTANAAIVKRIVKQ